MKSRQEEIHSKGFGMSDLEFGKIKVGKKVLDDAIFDLGALKAANKNYGNKAVVLKALANKDVNTLREISNYFYRTSGIYFRVCNYFAQMYRYDWYIVPEVYDNKEFKQDKLLTEFNKVFQIILTLRKLVWILLYK